MLTIGLTGGIGSGKSTVARLFQAKGITIIDTDQITRDLTQPGQPALAQIIKKFGLEILLPDQSLNRAKLRDIIFIRPSAKAWLENLLHPLVRMEIQRQITNATSSYCIVVIPLLFETAPNPLINRILLVDATEEQQLQRTQQRDQLSHAAVQAILQSQAKREQRIQGANDIIHNEGPIENLASQVEQLHQYFSQLSQ